MKDIESKVAELMDAATTYRMSPTQANRDWLARVCRTALESASRLPDGWVAVPVEPTADMRNAFHAVTGGDVIRKGAAGSRWAAMIEARPEVPHD
jgi:hypothetical protein